MIRLDLGLIYGGGLENQTLTQTAGGTVRGAVKQIPTRGAGEVPGRLLNSGGGFESVVDETHRGIPPSIGIQDHQQEVATIL